MNVASCRSNLCLNTRATRCSRAPLRGRWDARRTIARNLSSNVRIIEVGPRDGLQNIKLQVPTSVKIELINRLAATGLTNIEATSFVSPKWVPQLSDGKQVMNQIMSLTEQKPLRFSVLTPNLKGFEGALAAGANEVVVFASATEAFSKQNQNANVDEALTRARGVVEQAKTHNLWVRGVVSCIFDDPYTGPSDPKAVVNVVKQFFDMGCDEVGLGDTLGQGTPKKTQLLLELLLKEISPDKLTAHFHDTYGQAVANVQRAYDMGLRTFESSVAGLGGCPYAPGAKGNVATEDIVYAFENSGIDTAVSLPKLAAVGDWISQQLGLSNNSRAGAALMANQKQHHAATTPKPDAASPDPESPCVHREREDWPGWTTTTQAEGYTVSEAGSAVKITLNRPENGNAMTTNMLESLTCLFQDLSADSSIFHIVLAASGRFFCTGMDLTRDGGGDSSRYHDKIVALFQAIDDAPQTTIAAIHGPCYGGGVGLGFACDVRLVSSAARWQLSEIKLGVSPAIISKYMAREWGIPFFREAMLSGREIGPRELRRIGAVHGVAADQTTLDDMVVDYLKKLETSAPRAAATCKELVRNAFVGPGSRKQDDFIRQTFDNMLAPGSEGRYGIKQFRQKRRNINWKDFWAAQQAQ